MYEGEQTAFFHLPILQMLTTNWHSSLMLLIKDKKIIIRCTRNKPLCLLMQHFFLITFQTQTVTIATAEITATANTTNTAMSATEKKSYISNSSDMS